MKKPYESPEIVFILFDTKDMIAFLNELPPEEDLL